MSEARELDANPREPAHFIRVFAVFQNLFHKFLDSREPALIIRFYQLTKRACGEITNSNGIRREITSGRIHGILKRAVRGRYMSGARTVMQTTKTARAF
ncbi:MAG: hypothetical protein CVT48_01410 [Thermoplasmata archaeon HGW-Thermoplasmata-1]|nr:MAG: hypothetical protein CVT48_01410 [Thermoplasmata archaeon HGW-Thermoplasmata-1]